MRKIEGWKKYALLATEMTLALQIGCQSVRDRTPTPKPSIPELGLAIKCNPINLQIVSREQTNRLHVFEVYNRTQDQKGVVAVSPKSEGVFIVTSENSKFKSNNGDIDVKEQDIVEVSKIDATSSEVIGPIATQVNCN